MSAGGDDFVVEADARLARPEDEGLVGERLQRDRGAGGERVVGGQDGDERLLGDAGDDEPGRRLGRANEADVEAAVLERGELFGGVELADVDGHVGSLGGEDAHERRQHAVESRSERADDELAGAAAGRVAGRSGTALDFDQCTAGAGDERRSGRREAHAAACALEQRGPELGFEARDVLAERGLGHADPFGRAAEVQLFGHGEERAKGAQLHR